MPTLRWRRARLRTWGSGRHRGQSLAEFVLVLPVLLLLTLVAIDFGRIYLGYINLQNMARIAANYAATHPTSWGTGDTYRNQIIADASAINCTLPESGGEPVVPDPTFPGGTGVLGSARVDLTCSFGVVTPIISNIVGNTVDVSASAEFPVRSGMVASTGGGEELPTADFVGSPTSGPPTLTVQFTDLSSGSPPPIAWYWNFGDGATSTLQNPTHDYTADGTYTVSLRVTSASGTSPVTTKTAYISVVESTADFSGTPVTGNAPLTVDFTDLSTGSPTAWAWTFGDGQTSSLENPGHTYEAAGWYDVSLTVTFGTGPITVTKKNYVKVDTALCTVPDFTNTSSDDAQATWAGAEFTTDVKFKQPSALPYIITTQSVVGNSMVPCDSTIMLGP